MAGRTITVEIDPTTKLPDRYLGTDEDGPQYGPMSLYDAIIQAAVLQLVGYGEKAVRELVVEQMRETIARELDERLPAIIEEAMAEEVEVGDGFSSRKESMKRIIAERVQQEIRPSREYWNDTTFDKVVKEQVEHAIHKDFAEEVAKARAALRAKVTEKAAELLASETLRAAGVQ